MNLEMAKESLEGFLADGWRILVADDTGTTILEHPEQKQIVLIYPKQWRIVRAADYAAAFKLIKPAPGGSPATLVTAK